MKTVILGLAITSSWGNGHATTYRALVKALAARGHDVLFLERDMPWYADNRDLRLGRYGRIELYRNLHDLRSRFRLEICEADLVIVGSFVPDGIRVGKWVIEIARGIPAFYDIDTPVTLSKLKRGNGEYISRDLIPRYRLYLSFTGGPLLRYIERTLGSPMARPLYCSVDPELYFPCDCEPKWDLGYMGTYSNDRQPMLNSLMLEPARQWTKGRMIVAGPQYPNQLKWPDNVIHFEHLSPMRHRTFYNSQRFTLNITRRPMVRAGHSPSVRLFEAAACATPIISDWWCGLESFLMPGEEVLIARSAGDTLRYLRAIPESERRAIGLRAQQRVLAGHTADHRARELEQYVKEASGEA
ncbi:MAG: glycosyltransferase [Deltaproteobacteria bacterium]|nr:glycosyltransferase [Deltaproteobacteria bacterium]